MRIISKFHDYYDSVQAMGQDRSLVYVRNPEEIDCKQGGFFFPSCTACFRTYYDRFDASRKLDVDDHVVGFCGKIYPVVKLIFIDRNRPMGEEAPKKFCYNMDDVDGFIHEHFRDKQIECYESKDFIPNSQWQFYHRRRYFTEFFTVGEEKKYEKHFIEKRCPIIVGDCRHKKIIYNGKLKDVDFFRVFDPYRAFQEIAMYYGNMAVPLKPIPEITDETMAEIKGFDKFSFRKDKKK